MVDVKKEVKLEFTADTSGVRRAMQEFSAYQKEMSQNASKISSTGLKSHKDIGKIAKQNHKLEELTRGKKALHAEKTLYREVKKHTHELVKRSKIYKSTAKHVGHIKGHMRSVTVEAKKAGTELRNMAHFFTGIKLGGGGGRGGGGGGGARGGPGGRRGGRRGGMLRGFGRGLLGGLGGLAVGGLLGMAGSTFGLLTGQLSGGYSEREQYGRAYGQLAGTGGRRSALNQQMGFGARMGFGGVEMAQQALPFARATGVVGGGALRTGMALQRATSLNTGEAAGFMGMMTQAGTGFGGQAGKAGKTELVKTLALGVHSGLDRARMPEFLTATTQLVQRQMGATAGRVDSSEAARLLALLGSSGKSGLQGARGGAVASALDKAIRQPGGGEAGQAFMLQAMGFGKPGGDTSYYEALRKQEHGIFGEGNLQAMFAESKSQYGGGQAQILALRTLTGLTIDQLEDIRDVVQSGKSQEEQQKALAKIEEEAKSVEEQALDEMKEFGDTTRHMAELQNHSITVGNAVKEAVEDIQRVINEMIIRALPGIKATLDVIAEAVRGIWDYIKTWLDPQFTEEQKAKIADMGERAEEVSAEAARKLASAYVDQAAAARTAAGSQRSLHFGFSTPQETGRLQEAAQLSGTATRIYADEAQRLEANTRLQNRATSIIDDLARDGLTRQESRQLSRLSESMEKLSDAFETQGATEQISALNATHALIAAIDEARRSRAGSPPNEDRDSPRTPTRTGRGR